jgi:hypothetical protein
MKNVVLFLFVIIFLLVGAATILADVVPPLFAKQAGQLHFVNGVVGSGALLFAVLFAIPMKVDEALKILSPYLDRLLRRDKTSV